MSLKAEEFKVVRADALPSVRGVRAFQASATVLGFGALIWGGFFMYDLFSNTIRRLEESFRTLTQDPSAEAVTVVNTAVLTEEGIMEAVKKFKPRGSLSRASYERALRMIAEKVNAEGEGVLTNRDISVLKHAEGSLVKMGMIDKREVTRIHPVDRVSDFVVRDKNYWGLVLGLTIVPALPVVAGILREAKGDV